MLTEKKTPQSIQMRYDLYVPEGPTDGPLPLLIALHGYEGNKESMMAVAQKINRDDFLIASLQGPNGFFVRDNPVRDNPVGDAGQARRPRLGFGWMMAQNADETIDLHHRTVRAMIEEIATAAPLDRERIFLLAFSQAVSLNYRFAFTHPNTVRGVIAVCGGIPGDWDEDRYQESDTDVLIIAGEDAYRP